MNNFRAGIISGTNRHPGPSLLGEKQPRGTNADRLDQVPVSRDATRTTDHREQDRHRLAAETAAILFRKKLLAVDLINLSGGGAMVRGKFAPRLWERVDLMLGESASLECAVLWIRDDRIGLEFAHETQIHGDPETRDAMLLDVIHRSFPDLAAAPAAAEPKSNSPAMPDPEEARRGEARHPLIWSGTVLYNHDSIEVRLRNISPTGALIESPASFPPGAEVYLDLGEAGSLFATVSWAHGDQVGLTFAEPFDIANLAKAPPTVTPQRWATPKYLRPTHADGSPWETSWDRLSVAELKASLEGFLKH